jgi:glycine/D-amino acid oxidase-like deaminating enzyme
MTMDRRTLLKIGGMGLIGAGLSGCAGRSGSSVAPTAPSATPGRPPLRLAPVRAEWDRIIRTTVGLRPHRPSGFRLAADRLDATTVIHNYGHGGSGMSLSWGTGRMAAEMALAHDSRRAAVIGCGAVGLTAARQLQRRGFAVTIYAMSVPPNTTSNMSFAGFTPTAGLVEDELRTPAWDAQFREAVEISYRELQLLSGTRFGVSWIDRYALSDTPPGAAGEDDEEDREPLLPAHLRSGQLTLEPGEHPFPNRYAIRGSQLRIEPSIYLDALVHDFIDFGGRIEIRKFTEPRELVELNEPLVVNCSGLGARDLFDDDELLPAKGQLTVLVPQEEVDCGIGGDPPDGDTRGLLGIHMQPRRDGIVLGGTSERGEWSTEPNQEALRLVVSAHMAVYSAMRV